MDGIVVRRVTKVLHGKAKPKHVSPACNAITKAPLQFYLPASKTPCGVMQRHAKPGRGASLPPSKKTCLARFPVSGKGQPCLELGILRQCEWLWQASWNSLAVAGLPLWLPRWAARLAEIPIVLWRGGV